jgi:hypothetical protein
LRFGGHNQANRMFLIDYPEFLRIISRAIFPGPDMQTYMTVKAFILSSLLVTFATAPLFAEEGKEAEGTIFTLWPLIDYRESPREGYSNLSLLGPLFKFQHRGDDRDLAVRPLFYETSNRKNKTAETEYLYPIASSNTSPEASTVQVLELYQKNIYRKDEEEKRQKGTMLFPFYISGQSEKYGPYTSVFPIYGDIYERFWRDEYHYVLFPLYGRTVKNGTTNRNYLYPIFSTTEGEKESGFQFWPLYGQASKEGVYRKRFVLWPFFMQESSALNTDNPTSKLYLLPFYASTNSPKSTTHYYLWPFFGHKTEAEGNQEEWDYLWPFWRTIRGEKRTMDSYLPFYSLDAQQETRKRWIMWPLFKHEELNSAAFCRDRDRVLYFLYTDDRQSWPKINEETRRTAFWPLYVYNRDARGVRSLGIPAPVEPILDKDGIERSWAPFWRLYQQKWDDNGDSAISLLWNLYWRERRGDSLAYELFPLVAYRSEQKSTDLRILKGLIRFRDGDGKKGLTFFWLPFGFHWGKTAVPPDALTARSEP